MKARMAALQTFVLTASMITWIIYDEGAYADGSFVFVTQIATCHHSLLQVRSSENQVKRHVSPVACL